MSKTLPTKVDWGHSGRGVGPGPATSAGPSSVWRVRPATGESNRRRLSPSPACRGAVGDGGRGDGLVATEGRFVFVSFSDAGCRGWR